MLRSPGLCLGCSVTRWALHPLLDLANSTCLSSFCCHPLYCPQSGLTPLLAPAHPFQRAPLSLWPVQTWQYLTGLSSSGMAGTCFPSSSLVPGMEQADMEDRLCDGHSLVPWKAVWFGRYRPAVEDTAGPGTLSLGIPLLPIQVSPPI